MSEPSQSELLILAKRLYARRAYYTEWEYSKVGAAGVECECGAIVF